MTDTSQVKLGQIVQIRNGRYAGSFAIIVDIQGGFVWLADGKRRKFDHPKKKNIKHIQPTKVVAKEVADALNETGSVEDAVLRHALNQYQSNHLKESN